MNVGSIGLVLASATSLSNVVLDVSRKKALVGRNLLRTTFLLRAATAFFITIVLLVRWGVGYAPHFWPDHVPPNVLSFMPPVGIYFFYLILDSSLIAINVVLYNRAVQVSPLSLTIPFLAFTPVFLLGTGYVILGEIPTLLKCEGILFVVLGSLLMHRRSFLKGFFEPFRVVFRERGSRYMLAVSLLFSITNPVDKKLVQLSDAYTYSWAYAMMSVLIFGVPILYRRAKQTTDHAPVRKKWIAITGFTDSLTLLLQLTTLKFTDVVICIALKRAGIILTVIAGWLIFREKDITDRLIAAAVMLVGALMVYLPMTFNEQMVVTAATLIGLSIALYATRNNIPAEAA
jgi:drug/metabolite transporter (DMT)-like permease